MTQGTATPMLTFDVDAIAAPELLIIGGAIEVTATAEDTKRSWESDNTQTCTWAECCDGDDDPEPSSVTRQTPEMTECCS